jgi:hypothetical protein
MRNLPRQAHTWNRLAWLRFRTPGAVLTKKKLPFSSTVLPPFLFSLAAEFDHPLGILLIQVDRVRPSSMRLFTGRYRATTSHSYVCLAPAAWHGGTMTCQGRPRTTFAATRINIIALRLLPTTMYYKVSSREAPNI